MGKLRWKPGNMLYPVPAVMISCQRAGERPNIITIAWAGTISTNPPMVSISIRKERYSYEIIKESKEFVINLASESLIKPLDYCGVKSGKDVDKFKEMKLTTFQMEDGAVPGIAQSPVNIYCKVKEIKELGSHDMFLAEVTGIYVEQELMDEKGKFHLNSEKLIAYSHGAYHLLGEEIGTFGYSVRKKK